MRNKFEGGNFEIHKSELDKTYQKQAKLQSMAQEWVENHKRFPDLFAQDKETLFKKLDEFRETPSEKLANEDKDIIKNQYPGFTPEDFHLYKEYITDLIKDISEAQDDQKAA